MRTLPLALALAVWLLSLPVASLSLVGPDREVTDRARDDRPAAARFEPSSSCLACHNGLTTTTGADVSIGAAWRGSMMANSARDPYWQASVRRETLDHPAHREAIEDECATCHMPMARAEAVSAGARGQVFAHLPVLGPDRPSPQPSPRKRGEGASPGLSIVRSPPEAPSPRLPARRSPGEVGREEGWGEGLSSLAADGVSCTLCHQVTADKFGHADSFNGGFVLSAIRTADARPLFGPYPIDPGRATVMHSSSGFRPTESAHVRQSELCATCHTLYTNALGADGAIVGRLPEQMPYLEWRHSAYRDERSCQDCHMPRVTDGTPFSSVLGETRFGWGRHSFRGGNAFMTRMLNRYRDELGVIATSGELEAAAAATLPHLEQDTARVAIDRAVIEAGRLRIDVSVRNLAGHKLPTGYPSRRVWLHLAVRDGDGRLVFESGAIDDRGAIAGNDNDRDPTTFERHHDEISRSDEVQIYESVLADASGAVTTALLRGVRFAKDNRVLPRGFDKARAGADIAVHGEAADDASFVGGADTVRYSVAIADASGPFTVEIELRYQSIAFRWAQNLAQQRAAEIDRFVSWYDAMAAGSSTRLAAASAVVVATRSASRPE